MERKAVRITHSTSARWLAHLRAPTVAGLLVLTGACDSERLDTATEPESAAEASPALASSSSNRGVPFGFWRLEYTELGSDWTGLFANATTNSIRRNLDIARSKGARVFIRFAGGSPDRYQDSQGHFSLTKFRALLDGFRNVDLNSYIADGTLAGHLMLDEPSDENNWNGVIPFRDLEEAAKYSKAIWPNLPTFVRSVPSWLAGAPFRWEYLDGGWAQYSARKGQVDSYREAQVRAANDEGLKVVWGLNVLDGGDGSSNRRFGSSSKYSMSASEVLKYGRSLLAASNSCGFLMWHYTSEYLGSSGVNDAMKSLSAEAKTASASCGDGGGSTPEEPPVSEDIPLAAAFTGSCNDLSCEFKDASAGTVVSWAWQFGDGSTSEQQDPAHTYAAGQTYPVDLTVTDDKGATSVFSGQVTPSNPPVVVTPENVAPVASFDVGCSGLTCSFSDQSRDVDGSIVSRSWDFGGSTSGSGASRTYASAGTYTVTLTITDDEGAVHTASKPVTVNARVPSPPRRSPRALFGSSCRSRTCTFSDRSKANDSKIERWRWYFGNGNTSTSRNPSYRYSSKGTYKVVLTVTDADGDSNSISHRVTVK